MGSQVHLKLIFISFVVAIILATLCISAYSTDDEAWEEYKSIFEKTYASAEEENLRKQVFLDNKRFIESHNTKSKASFTQGLNELSDLTTEEINKSRNGFRFPGERDDRPLDALLETLLIHFLNNTNSNFANFTQDLQELDSANSTSTRLGGIGFKRSWLEDQLSPPKLDWRTSGRVTRVKDQGSCGSCWAFATTGAVESVLLAHNRSFLLSEQNLVDCSTRYGNHGCAGGLMDQALRYIRDHGIMSSRDYPYTARDGSCKFKPEKSVTSVRGSAMLPRGNEALLRLTLSLAGPLPVAIDASGRAFHSYKSGVYNDGTCKNSNGALNHAVLLVGYGTDPSGGDYWIVKNSWGTKWGESGYIKMARNRGNLCGISSYVIVPIP